jgi:hypothetical protein
VKPGRHVRVLGQAVRLPQGVVVGQAVVTTALDVEGSQVQARSTAGTGKQEGPQVLSNEVVQLQRPGHAKVPDT